MRVSRAHLLLATGVAGTAAVLATVSGISIANAAGTHPAAQAARPAAAAGNAAAPNSSKTTTTSKTTGKTAATTDKPPPTRPPPAKAATTTSKAVNGRLGPIISTGMDASKISEWVIYGIPVKNKYNPLTTFGFRLSERHNNGTLTPDLYIAETSRPDLAPGFHAVEGAYTLEGGIEQPAFGYFVGHPAKITTDVAGKSVTAHTVVWSQNPAVTVFWFDNTKVTGATTLTTMNAYDTTGHRTATTAVPYQ